MFANYYCNKHVVTAIEYTEESRDYILKYGGKRTFIQIRANYFSTFPKELFFINSEGNEEKAELGNYIIITFDVIIQLDKRTFEENYTKIKNDVSKENHKEEKIDEDVETKYLVTSWKKSDEYPFCSLSRPSDNKRNTCTYSSLYCNGCLNERPDFCPLKSRSEI